MQPPLPCSSSVFFLEDENITATALAQTIPGLGLHFQELSEDRKALNVSQSAHLKLCCTDEPPIHRHSRMDSPPHIPTHIDYPLRISPLIVIHIHGQHLPFRAPSLVIRERSDIHLGPKGSPRIDLPCRRFSKFRIRGAAGGPADHDLAIIQSSNSCYRA